MSSLHTSDVSRHASGRLPTAVRGPLIRSDLNLI
jgi:hypothetical protein